MTNSAISCGRIGTILRRMDSLATILDMPQHHEILLAFKTQTLSIRGHITGTTLYGREILVFWYPDSRIRSSRAQEKQVFSQSSRPEEYWIDFLASATMKRCALVKFRQRISPRWHKLSRGGFWHIGALSCHNVMYARKKGWQVKIMSVWYASKETSGNNDEGVCEHKDSQAPQQVQAQLWRDVGL